MAGTSGKRLAAEAGQCCGRFAAPVIPRGMARSGCRCRPALGSAAVWHSRATRWPENGCPHKPGELGVFTCQQICRWPTDRSCGMAAASP